MFDKKFNGEPLVDKRGKRVKKTDNDNLRKFYEVEENVKKIRGECNDLESSSSDESSDEEEEEVEDENETAEQIDSKVLRTDDVTCRFAVTNVDWDQLKAVDLFVLLNSFKPSNGEILSVKIYLSQFGKERLEAEKLEGPKELTEVKLEEDEEDPYESNNWDADEIINTDCPFVSEKLRKYQLNRLKYYYAVVECDSPDTAATLYDQLDGMEYESSASTLDLRFIPDDMSFDDDEPTSVCNEMPSLIDYKPPLFITTALQQTKVRLTWDETDPKRAKTLERAFTERDKISDDLACYLASSSEEEADELSDEEEITLEGKSLQDRINKYKDLLANVERDSADDEKDIDMEVKWEPELENIGQKIVEKKQKEKMSYAERQLVERKEKRKELKKLKKQSATEAPEQDSDNENEESDGDDEQYPESDKQSDESDENSDDESPKKRDDLELLVMDSTKKDRKHFDYSEFVENKKSKKKWKKKKDKSKQSEDNFKFDPEDSRFAAIYKSHLYNVDQSSSHFKKTQAYEEILKRKASINPDTKYPVKKSK
uniref:Uncharacterized protein n=2 Tax=Tetranychus urticae TaxID=32264 RepID=T1JSQ1_TETUR